MEARARRQAEAMGIPLHRTPAFRRLQRRWYGKLARAGFVDIEYEDPVTKEPGSMLRGLNTAQMLAMGGHHPGRVRDAGVAGPTARFRPSHTEDPAADERARTARMRMEAQTAFFDWVRAQMPRVEARWKTKPWRVKAMDMYADGLGFDEIADRLGRTDASPAARPGRYPRSRVKAAIQTELKWLRTHPAPEGDSDDDER